MSLQCRRQGWRRLVVSGVGAPANVLRVAHFVIVMRDFFQAYLLCILVTCAEAEAGAEVQLHPFLFSPRFGAPFQSIRVVHHLCVRLKAYLMFNLTLHAP